MQVFKTLVVYDSQFGNTARIAQAIAEALAMTSEVKCLPVTQVEPADLAGLDLLVLGSATQKFRPLAGTNALLAAIPAHGLKGVRAAAFDTRMSGDALKSPFFRWIVKLGGYAADFIADRLLKLDAELLIEPEGFLVSGVEGPLLANELERAREWARQVRARCPLGKAGISQ